MARIVTFAMNWVAGSSLTPQITKTFFGGPVDPVVSELVNYSITTARVFANILAAIILMRLGAKKAVGVGVGLLIMGLIAIGCQTIGHIRLHGWSWRSVAQWSLSI